jgi:hypothetical protein
MGLRPRAVPHDPALRAAGLLQRLLARAAALGAMSAHSPEACTASASTTQPPYSSTKGWVT